MLEVCVDSLESAINAIHGGCDELEVCSSLNEGGLTPTAGLVKQIKKMVDNIATGNPIYKTCSECACSSLKQKPKINIMIRCRAGSDFCYSEEEMDTMLEDIDIFKTLGVDRFVFGALTISQSIDRKNCTKVIESAKPLPVTFHRAFDMCKDEKDSSVETIINLGFSRLLTSGRQAAADNPDALIMIDHLNCIYGDQIEIMPGAGINDQNAWLFISDGCKIIHSSCKRVKSVGEIKYNSFLYMGCNSHNVTDEDLVRNVKKQILEEMF